MGEVSVPLPSDNEQCAIEAYSRGGTCTMANAYRTGIMGLQISESPYPMRSSIHRVTSLSQGPFTASCPKEAGPLSDEKGDT